MKDRLFVQTQRISLNFLKFVQKSQDLLKRSELIYNVFTANLMWVAPIVLNNNLDSCSLSFLNIAIDVSELQNLVQFSRLCSEFRWVFQFFGEDEFLEEHIMSLVGRKFICGATKSFTTAFL